MRNVSFALALAALVATAQAQVDPSQAGSEPLTEVTLAGLPRPDGRASSLVVTLPQATHRAWPVVLFVHGWSARPTDYSGLVENLASRGFAVANFDQIDRFELDLRLWEQAGITALDALSAAATNPASPLFGLLDLDHLAVMGHSYGGATTTCLAAADPRVKAAVALTPGASEGAPKAHWLQRATQVRIPLLVVGAELDPIVPVRTNALPAFRLLNTPQRLYVEITAAEHLTVTDLDIGYLQWTPRFPFWRKTRAPDEVRTVSRRYATGWIEHYLGIRADSLGLIDGSHAVRDLAQGSLSNYGTPTKRP